MDSQERTTGRPQGLEELLRSTPLFTLIGCPHWCDWDVRMPGAHSHVSDGVAELVLSDLGEGFPEVLEVRHSSAPAAPGL